MNDYKRGNQYELWYLLSKTHGCHFVRYFLQLTSECRDGGQRSEIPRITFKSNYKRFCLFSAKFKLPYLTYCENASIR